MGSRDETLKHSGSLGPERFPCSGGSSAKPSASRDLTSWRNCRDRVSHHLHEIYPCHIGTASGAP
jgi:hypothetical protein